MKRCPECRRDYFDDSLLYCLDDGAALLEGPGSIAGREEPHTAILPHTSPGEAATRAFIHTTDIPAPRTKPDRSYAKAFILGGALLLAAIVGSFFGYRYLTRVNKQITSIAVMPFVNDSGNPDIDYLSDGMTDTLISSLSQLPNLTVKARSAVFRYKGQAIEASKIGRDLNAEAVLSGHVVERAGRLIVNLELVDPATENVIWAGQYDRAQADLAAIQTDIARDVLSKIANKLSVPEAQKISKPLTVNSDAYRLLLQGRYLLDRTTREDTEKSITYFQQALDIDAGCAICWSEIGRAYAIEAGRAWMPSSEGFDKSRDATNKALSIDPDLAEGHAQLGRIQVTYDLDLKAAEASYRRALELAPSNASVQDGAAVLFYKLGRFDEAIALERQALTEDPLSPVFYNNLGLTCLAAGQLAQAEVALRKAIELAPQRFVTNSLLAIVLADEGRVDEAIAQIGREPDEVWRLWATGIICHRSGQKARSDDAIHQLVTAHTDGNAFQIAEVYAVRGETDQAFKWLETAYQQRDPGVTHAYADPQLRSLHSDSRWAGFIKKLGFVA